MTAPRVPMQMGPETMGVAGALGSLAQSIRGGRFPWWYPNGAKDKQIDYFVYTSDFVPLALSATVQNNVNINGDSAFCVLSGVLVETDTGNTIFLGQRPLLARIADTGSGRFISNGQVHVDNWFGTAEEPKYWDVPKIFAPNTTIGLELQNLEAVARNVRIALHGFKIFGFQA